MEGSHNYLEKWGFAHSWYGGAFAFLQNFLGWHSVHFQIQCVIGCSCTWFQKNIPRTATIGSGLSILIGALGVFLIFFSPLRLCRAQSSHSLLCPPVAWCSLGLNPHHWYWKGKSHHLFVFALFRVKKNVLHWSNTFVDYINSFFRHGDVSLLCSWCFTKTAANR